MITSDPIALHLDQDFEFGPAENFVAVGKYNFDTDSEIAVTGRFDFPYDRLPGKKLFAAILGCPHAHCRITSIDTRKAEALEGVKAVITYKDNPQYDTEEILVWGWEVAAVAATDPYIAESALDLIEVEYEVLPFILDPEEAMKPGATLAGTYPDTNVGKPSVNTRGDIDAGFAEADKVFEYETGWQRPHTQNTLEPCAAIAWWEGEHVYGWDQNQNPHTNRNSNARHLGLPYNKCHFNCNNGGGGFGGGGQTCEPTLCAILSKMTGKPVAYQRTRRLQTIRRRNHYSPKGWIKVGVKNDGTLTAFQGKWWAHGGFNGARGNAWESLDSFLLCPNIVTEVYAVATNTGFGAGYR